MMESFFLGEELGSDPISSRSSCKSIVNECKFCSSESAPCSAQEELEYRYLKDNCKFEASVEGLISKYPWPSDPVILQDDGYQALAFQHKLEDSQLKENTFVEYAQDIIDRNVVSEISPLELKVMEGNLSNDCSQDTNFDPEIHNFKSLLVASKARVAPLDWIIVPRSELSSLNYLLIY